MRKEFSSKVCIAAFERAKGLCEICAMKLFPGWIRYDHIVPDWMGGDNSLENCQVICVGCDKIKTRKDQRDIGKVRRVRARHVGAVSSARPLPCGRRSKWKKKINGALVLR